MKVVLQKVHNCSLSVEDKLISQINNGMIVTVGVHRDDNYEDVEYIAGKIAKMRMWKDDNDKINLSVLDVNGEILVVSNFTLQANVANGTRPSFSNGADKELADNLYKALGKRLLDHKVSKVVFGSFGNHMHLDCILDGPYTIIIDSKNKGKKS